MNKLDRLKEILDKIGSYKYTIALLRWDMDTTAPKKSFDYLIDVSSKYELEAFKLSTSDEYINIINDLISSDEYNNLNDLEKKYILQLKDDYDRFKRIPEEFYQEHSKLCSNSLNAWVSAKEKKDYQIFKPFLIKMIESTKKLYSYMYPNNSNIYDCMLNDYEKGITSGFIDNLFNKLKVEIIPIIKNLNNNNINKLQKKYDDSKLIELAKYLLNYIGFDNNRGALATYIHGYTMKLNDDDVRITFSNTPNITDIISTVVHEGGHGIFEQNVSNLLTQYKTYDVNKCGLHESQSRFYENILGRNKNFFIPIFDDLKRILDIDITLDEFINMFNDAKRSKIRTQADELTYCIHIIIRYEMERDIFSDKVDLEELPNIWNKKYKDYLGVDIENDGEGILQDMHWSEGAFGYFPFYLMGTIFDGMLLENVNQQLGNVDELLKNGRIKIITKYLNDNIHFFGGIYNINEVSNRVCGTDLNVDPIIRYFKDKYGR